MSAAPDTRGVPRTSFGTRPIQTQGVGSTPAEVTTIHTRILRCMLAVDDSATYWRRVDPQVPVGERARVAFEQRWFGAKSEARLRTIMTDLVERFDAFPQAFELLRRLDSVPSGFRPWICHVHTQLADPIYRRFTGEFLPARRDQGYVGVDRATVARWVEELEPGRWGAASRSKFASNLLATAAEAGLVAGRRDPRKLLVPVVPGVVVGYVLYLLRGVSHEGSLTDNAYLRSLGITPDTFRSHAPRIPDVHYAELGGVGELTFEQANLLSYGLEHLGGAS